MKRLFEKFELCWAFLKSKEYLPHCRNIQKSNSANNVYESEVVSRKFCCQRYEKLGEKIKNCAYHFTVTEQLILTKRIAFLFRLQKSFYKLLHSI